MNRSFLAQARARFGEKLNPRKITSGEVRHAHDDWARAMGHWGENNLATIRALGNYQDARRRFEQDHGREWNYGRKSKSNPRESAIPAHKLAQANRYANLLRNKPKRDYAFRYIAWLKGGAVGESPESKPLSVMAAQAVRLQLDAMRLWENPSTRAKVAQAAQLAEDFSGHKVTASRRVSLGPSGPALVFGELLEVKYRTKRDGVVEHYRHPFRASSRPLLAARHDGSRVYIVGGRYRFTERGIVDE